MFLAFCQKGNEEKPKHRKRRILNQDKVAEPLAHWIAGTLEGTWSRHLSLKNKKETSEEAESGKLQTSAMARTA